MLSVAPTNVPKPEIKLPISTISSVLDLLLIDSHLDKLSLDELKSLYSEYLPSSMSSNPTKAQIMDIIRSGFYAQSEQKLSELLSKGSGAGYLLAQSLKYEYKGEGIDGFLNGIRELAKKEKKEEEEQQQKEDHDEVMKD